MSFFSSAICANGRVVAGCVVLTGAGRAFAAGADIKEMKDVSYFNMVLHLFLGCYAPVFLLLLLLLCVCLCVCARAHCPPSSRFLTCHLLLVVLSSWFCWLFFPPSMQAMKDKLKPWEKISSCRIPIIAAVNVSSLPFGFLFF